MSSSVRVERVSSRFLACLVFLYLTTVSAKAEIVYDFDEVAERSTLGLSELSQFPGISDSGKVGFTGLDSSGVPRAYLFDGSSVTEQTFSQFTNPFYDNFDIQGAVQVDVNDNLTAWFSADFVIGGQTFYRLSEIVGGVATISGSCAGQGGPGLLNPLFSARAFGNLTYSGIADDSCSGNTLLYSRGFTNGFSEESIDIGGTGDVFPLIADNDRITTRFGTSDLSPLRRYNAPDFSSFDLFADPLTLGFTKLGARPGAAASAEVIGFIAEIGGPSQAVVHLRRNAGSQLSQLMEVAGVSGNGFLELGETHNDANNDGILQVGEDEGPYASIDTDGFVRVTRIGLTNTVQVLFEGERVGGDRALSIIEIDVTNDAQPALLNSGTVVELGTQVDGIPGTVLDFSIYDPTDESGRVALWLLTTAGEYIVRGNRSVIEPIRVEDPNPVYLDGVNVSTDIGLLSSETAREVEGYVADGVTTLVLSMDVPEPGTATVRVRDENDQAIEVGTLSTIAGTENTDELVGVSSVATTNGDKVIVTLQAPANFVRPGNTADELLGRNNPRQIRVEAEFTPNGGGDPILYRSQLRLDRPSVFLLHGLWGERDTWEWSLEADTRFRVTEIGYEERASNSIPSIPRFVRREIEDTLRNQRLETNLAMTRVDFIAHSMGGLVLRNFANTPSIYFLEENLGAGYINKFITVSSPHSGSKMANLLVDEDGRQTGFGFVYDAVDDTNGGAVRDLRTDSNFICSQVDPLLPSHAITGDGEDPLTSAALNAILLFIPPPETLDSFFGTTEHDGIVTVASQKGGLVSPSVSPFFGSDAEHRAMTENDAVSLSAVDLLNLSITDPAFSISFPTVTCPPSPPAPIQTVFAEDILIVEQSGIMTVSPSQTVRIVASGIAGFQPDTLLLIAPEQAIEFSAPTLETDFTIPAEEAGSLKVIVLGKDSSGSVRQSNSLEFSVVPSSQLLSLSRVPDKPIKLVSYAPDDALRIFGDYADGITRNISDSEAGTTYQSQDENVVTVGVDGEVVANRVGSTTILVSNAGVSTSVLVEVESVPGDSNSDGAFDASDGAAFNSCYSGKTISSGFTTPTTDCLDSFDFDFDGDVDCLDWAKLFKLFDVTPPQGPVACTTELKTDIFSFYSFTRSELTFSLTQSAATSGNGYYTIYRALTPDLPATPYNPCDPGDRYCIGQDQFRISPWDVDTCPEEFSVGGQNLCFTFFDNNVQSGITYFYWVSVEDGPISEVSELSFP